MSRETKLDDVPGDIRPGVVGVDLRRGGPRSARRSAHSVQPPTARRPWPPRSRPRSRHSRTHSRPPRRRWSKRARLLATAASTSTAPSSRTSGTPLLTSRRCPPTRPPPRPRPTTRAWPTSTRTTRRSRRGTPPCRWPMVPTPTGSRTSRISRRRGAPRATTSSPCWSTCSPERPRRPLSSRCRSGSPTVPRRSASRPGSTARWLPATWSTGGSRRATLVPSARRSTRPRSTLLLPMVPSRPACGWAPRWAAASSRSVSSRRASASTTTSRTVSRRRLIDAVAFGRPFIANPDLPRRLVEGLAPNDPVPATFYGGGSAGYTDYPAYTG